MGLIKEKALEQAATEYAKELIKARTVKDYEQSWIEAVYLFVAKSEDVKSYHSDPEKDKVIADLEKRLFDCSKENARLMAGVNKMNQIAGDALKNTEK